MKKEKEHEMEQVIESGIEIQLQYKKEFRFEHSGWVSIDWIGYMCSQDSKFFTYVDWGKEKIRLKQLDMRKVITYGTYDLLHHGHIRLLERASDLGDWLIVGLSTDEFNKEKGKEAVLTYAQRKEVLESIECVDEVIPEVRMDQKYHDVPILDIDVFVMGDDWEGQFDDIAELCQVKYLPRTKGISTTAIKQSCKTFSKNN